MKKYFVFLMTAAVIILFSCSDDEIGTVKESKIIPVEGITISKNESEMMGGVVEQLYITVSPDNARNRKVTWSSSASDVASVEFGEITAKKVGTATITVKTIDGGFEKTCKVTVIPYVAIPVKGVTMETALTMETARKIAMVANVTPAEADNKEVTWVSETPGVASIDANTGVLTGLKPGTTKITVTTVEGEFTATCDVTVTDDFLVADFEWDAVGTNYPVYYSNGERVDGLCEVVLEPLDMDVKTPPTKVDIPRGAGKALNVYGTQNHAEYGMTGVHMGPEIEVTLPTGAKLGDYKFLYVDMYFVTAAGNGGVSEPTNNWNAGAGWAGWGDPRLNIKMDADNSVFTEDLGGNPRALGSKTFPENVPFKADYWSAYTWARGIELDLSKLKLPSEYQDLSTFKIGLSIRSGALNLYVDNFILKK
jgi:hypothetical protein